MITEEERAKLNKGDIVYECVFYDDEQLVSKRKFESMGENYIYLKSGQTGISRHHIKSGCLFVKESDAIKCIISFHKEQIIEINDKITELNNQLESLENG